MLFNSWQFGIFFPAVFIIYWLIPDKFRWVLLLISSLYFYMSWNAKYIILILFTTFISYIAGILLNKIENKPARKFILVFALISCLGVLFVFKYFNFAVQILDDIFKIFAIKLHPITLNLLLPVGISFYTFQTLGYVIDVYKNKIEPEKNFGIYATFISFFPQLVAGPIERTNNLLPQIKSAKKFNYEQTAYGIKLMTWGFFKKLVIADNLAIYSDKIFNDVYKFHGFALLFGIFAFTIQIYCDFSGYSDIAQGCSKMLGINLMENFKSPYFSSSIREFWSRWHISLSTWFRDYLYIPLGGNRVNKFRHNLNIFVTFLISGLWHGASWNFIIWGSIHGTAQILENIFIDKHKTHNGINKFFRILCVFIFCSLAWIFFRANNFNEAIYITKNFLNGITNLKNYYCEGIESINLGGKKALLFNATLLGIYDYISLKYNVIKKITSNKYLIFRYLIYFGIITAILFFMASNEVAFVYFQF